MNEQAQNDLEMRVTFQEKAIEDLREAQLEQQTVIYKLQAEVKRLNEKLTAVLSGGQEIGPANQKPPHY